MPQETQHFPAPWRAGILLLGLSCLTPVSAQLQDLATTDDGRTLYFSSTLRLKGSTEYSNARIFRFANGKYDLIAQVVPTVTLSDGSTFHFAFRLPNVSGDGGILAFDGTASCSGGPLCQGAFTARGFITGSQLPPVMTSYGSLRVSHNGRYTIRFGGTQSGISPGPVDLYDSQTGQLTLVRGSNVIGDGRQSVADDGTVVIYEGLSRVGQIQPIAWWHPPVAASLSSNGSGVAYDAAVQSTCHGDLVFGYCDVYNILYARGLKTAAQVQLAQSPVYRTGQRQNGQAWFFPSLSNDGSTILFRAPPQPSSPPQAIISNIDGSGRRVVTAEESGIKEAALSGDGHHAYAATGDGGLIAIDIDNGDVQRLLPGAPLIFQSPTAVVPGSLVTFSGQFLSAAAGQSRVSLAGYSAPVLASSFKSVILQIPWEFDLNNSATFIFADPASPFEQTTPIESAAAAPLFAGVLHQDFRGAPTSKDPHAAARSSRFT